MSTQVWFALCVALAAAAGFVAGWYLGRPGHLAAAKHRLAQALEDAQIPLAVWDREDRLIACNTPFRAVYSEVAEILQPGITYAAMNKRYFRVGRPEIIGTRSESEFLHQTTRRRSGPQLIETTARHDGRSVLLLEYRHESGTILSLQLDLTEQRAEAAAAQAGRQFRDGLLELSDDFYWQMDASGRITQFAGNDEASQDLDCSRFVGHTLRELPGFSANEHRLEQFEKALRERRPTAWLHIRVTDGRSAPVWLMFRARPMRQLDGTLGGYHGWARSVSAIEQALRQ